MVDIIIPAYNTHNYITDTLNSILQQTYKEKIKVYIVDDCSETKYTEIYKQYIDKIDITLLELKENRGPGFCRQYGIENSNSKYIIFIDSDDCFIDKTAIDKMVNEMEKNNYDALSAMVTEDYYGVISTRFVGFDTIHAKIYRRKFLEEKNIHFPYTYNSEDIAFNNLVLLSTENLGQIDCNVYLYKRRKNSLTQSENYNTKSHIKFYCDNLYYVIKEAEKNNIDKRYISTLLHNSYSYFMWYFKNETTINDSSIKNIFSLINYYDKYDKYYNDNVGCFWLKFWIDMIKSNYSDEEYFNFIEMCRSNYNHIHIMLE